MNEIPSRFAPGLNLPVNVGLLPPGTSACEPLIDVLVHGQDITVPLGIEWPMPTDAAAAAAERVWGMGFPFHAQRRLRDVELVGADADFHLGEGRRIEAPIRDILMEVAGRPSSISPAITASDRPAAQA